MLDSGFSGNYYSASGKDCLTASVLWVGFSLSSLPELRDIQSKIG